MRSEMWRWVVRGAGAAVGLLIIAAIAWGILRAADVVVLVFVSVLLASGLEPAIGWIRGKTGLGRAPTILIVYAAFLVLFMVLIVLIVPSAATQLGALQDRLPDLLSKLSNWGNSLPSPAAEVVQRLVTTIRSATQRAPAVPAPQDIVAAGGVAANAVISVISIFALIFFWLTGHQRLQRFSLAMLPANSRQGVHEAWNEVETRLGLWVRGQLILMATIFGMTTVAYFVLGLDGALFLGLVAGIAEAIPIVGPALGAVPAVIVAASTGRVELVLLVAVVYVVIQILEGNVLVPLVMRSTIGVPPFVVMVSLLIGAALGGIVGAFLAVPITAALVVVLERMQARDQPVPLESPASSESPVGEERDATERALPDSAGGKPAAGTHVGARAGG